MNTKLFRFIFCVTFLLLANITSFSQDKKIHPSEKPAPVQNDMSRGAVSENLAQDKEFAELEKKLLLAKNTGNINAVKDLQNELEQKTGAATVHPESFPLTLVSDRQSEADNINASFVSAATGVKGIATCTEQITSSAGRMWTAFVYGPLSGANPDNLRLCYRDFAGNSWNHYVTLGFSPGNRMNQDQIDIELIEDNTGDKYIYVAFGYITSSNQWRIGLTIVKITGGLNFAGYTLSWPGTNNSTLYHKPRIVSDNEAYHPNPWIYITACEDSAVAGGYYAGEKAAIVFSPYTVSPTITYKPQPMLGFLFRYPSDFYCDLAYYRNGGLDSIMIVESSLEDSSKIIIAKTSISSFVSSSFAQYVGNISTINNRRSYQAYIASAGGYNKLMIVNLRKYNNTDWDIEYYSSTNGSAGWSNGYIDYRSNYSTRADIAGFRSAPGFYATAYSENTNTFVPVVYSFCNNNIWGPLVTPTNHINTNPFTAQPRPGVKYGITEESCFTLWTEYSGSTNVWNSVGCSGSVSVMRNIFLRGVPQGMWDAPADTLRNDTMRLYMRNDFSPYSIVDSSKTWLDNDGYGNFWFTNGQNFVNYYIVAKHRNSIRTWSATTFQFNSNSTSYSYDFTTSPLQAYGVNMIQVDVVPDLYAFYSGEVSGDEIVDVTDVVDIFNDANNFASGYIITDVNGDQFTDVDDLLIAYNNSNNFVSEIRP